MANVTRFGFLAIAVIFHVVSFASIFDIYFVSPVVSGMRLFSVPREAPANKPPADRLVLFVGDGLRADKAFQSFPEPYPETDDDLTPRPLAPYLRSKVLNEATFGVSHTRVPTESRPGHVALIAGLYEDVSAVATGWKFNPVHFDSVFNRSSHTWGWGSPDILPMFEAGAVPGRMDAHTYGAELEDFSGEASHLDYWVFDHVKDFFAEAASNATLNKALREEKVVFFLHLLGLDTNGHGFRPYSKEYLNNIKIVDQGVKETVALIEKFYADDRTAFVFTADHGMSDWGSHGDGHPDNTRTPLIAWGSGVAAPQLYPDTVAPGHDEYSSDWGFDHVRRHDVAQADVAALMAYLIGTEFPANSVGELPLSYLAAGNREKATASLVNAQGILEMYRVKEEKKMASELRYRPYGPFSGTGATPEQRVAAIAALIESGKYEEAAEECDALITLAIEGLRYLQTYDWLFLRVLITVGYLGWMAYALTTVLNMFVVKENVAPQRTTLGVMFFSSILVGLYASFVVSKSPAAYYAYAFFPVFFWEEVYARRRSLAEGRKILFSDVDSTGAVVTFVLHTLSYVAVIILMAFGYDHREVFTGLFVLAALWPAAYGLSFIQAHPLLSLIWAISCFVMSSLTLLPAMKVEDVNLIMISGFVMAALGVFYLVYDDFVLNDFTSASSRQPKRLGPERLLVGIQVGLIILATLVTRSSAFALQRRTGLPLGNQIIGWAVMIISMLMPFAYRQYPNNNYTHKRMVLFLTCAPAFIILTISYEGIFYIAFCILLLAWVRLEYSIQKFTGVQTKGRQSVAEKPGDVSNTEHRTLRLSDARVALFFFVLLQSAFFSTGNVASISSFSLESVNRLIPVFDPFSQGALLIFKLMIPFALISANLGILNQRLGVAPSALFMVVLTISDVLTLYFFWVVRDEGSWLEIGSTISHFAIASLLGEFVVLLEGVSALFVDGIEVEDDKVVEKEFVADKANGSGGKKKTNGHAVSK
ncbi:phosphatidylinositolglycan class N (PIG-N) domain-containing protein [Sarocladium implicatum]|nr:phosphatidylinositolglycan class N (PIG-N) domain-containing protein [Sarocladium implicatum]